MKQSKEAGRQVRLLIRVLIVPLRDWRGGGGDACGICLSRLKGEASVLNNSFISQKSLEKVPYLPITELMCNVHYGG